MNSLFILCIFYICMTLECGAEIAAHTIPSNNASTDTDTSTIHPYLIGKHESLSNCTFFEFQPESYELFPNGTVNVEIYNLTLNDSHYILVNDSLFICVPFQRKPNEYGVTAPYLTLIGLVISMICLIIHLIAFSVVPDLRNMPGWDLASLCASLFCSYSLLLVISSGEITHYSDFCRAIAFLSHLFLLASILWMSVISCDVFWTVLQASKSLIVSNTQFSLKRFGFHCLFAFGIALLFAIASLLADSLDVVPASYKPEYKELCWFSRKTPLLIFFAGPVIALSCLNFLFFSLSAGILHFNKMQKNQDEQESILRRRYMMYFRLFVIMGITWIVGIVANIFNADWLWYIFVVLNTLQGFFIFIAFTCSEKVKKYLLKKISSRRFSESAPTFQSHVNAISTETDIDNNVGSSH